MDQIIDHKAESERIIFENDELMLLPDFMWFDLSKIDQLYIIAIFKDNSLRSIRDLNKSHLKMLKNVEKEISNIISTNYPSAENKFSVFFHYCPTFYRLHLHISVQEIDCHPSRVHFLSTVIQNIELIDDYYQKVSLLYEISENRELYQLIKQ